MRACQPSHDGYIERDGVKVFYEVFGAGAPTVLLLPTWSILHSRHWKLQVPYLARHCRVVTFDGRGNGRSDRPAGVAAYLEDEFAADALAVMDATGTDRATLVGLSCGALWGTIVAADHPERVAGIVYIAPAVGLAPPHPERQLYEFDEEYDTDEGWAKYNSHFWSRSYGSSWSSSSRRASPSPTRPSRSKMPSAGGWRPTRRRWRTPVERSRSAAWSASGTPAPAFAVRRWSSTATAT